MNRPPLSTHRSFWRSCKSANNIRVNKSLFWKFPPFCGFRFTSCVNVRSDNTHLSHPRSGLSMYKVSEGIRSTHGQDGAVVLDIPQGQMFNLNFVGSRILELLKDGSAPLEIVDEIVREFGVSRHLAENDVQDFLQTLRKYRVIENTDRG